ncbi:carbohydrate ABC transporter permease [Paenibacillus sp. PAMC21692]|uniref:carbohydrate ABC transporter permease n=1 Tax=Paenibacillus sp. PAMC21692 TaxID=2762320 RepID=UPI00164D99CD|nr:carbohydrate ABC transporter permease [Paenibacillus sp. PAMC21692]QNK57720.1 carbohydrate ABC transporter permease [Paenibacillus sp. PAMC21692]
MVYKETLGEKWFTISNYLFLILFGCSTVYLFFYILVLSFNDGVDALKGGIYFWPREFTLANYQTAFGNPNIMSAFRLSVLRAGVGTFLSVLLTSMAAYALLRKDLPGRKYIIFYCFFTTLFSGGIIPLYMLYKEIGLINSIWIYIIPGMYSFFNIIIIRTYFENIPHSLSESARMDGAGDLRIFFQIYLPLSKPVLATIALFVAVAHWNDWVTGAFFVNNPDLIPAATLLQKVLAETSFEANAMQQSMNSDLMAKAVSNTTPEALRMAFVIIVTIPVLCVYPFLQKYFVQGVMIGSIKE